MARTTSKIAPMRPHAVPPAPPPAAPQLDADLVLPRADNEEALLSLLTELRDNDAAKIGVYRVREGQRKPAYLGRLLIEDAADDGIFESVKGRWGGGTYLVCVHDGRSGKWTEKIEIDGPPIVPAEPVAPSLPAPPVVADPVVTQQLARLTDVVAQLAAAMTAQRSPDQVEESTIKRMQAMAELMRPLAAPAPAGDMNLFMQGLNLGRELQPSTGAGTEDVLVKALEAFAPVLRGAAQQAARPAPGRPQLPQPAAATADPLHGVPAEMRGLAALLLEAAAGKAPAEVYAPVMIDRFGWEACASLLLEADPVGALALYVPAVNAHRPWVESLVAAIREAMNESEQLPGAGDADVDTLGPSGGGDDVAHDA